MRLAQYSAATFWLSAYGLLSSKDAVWLCLASLFSQMASLHPVLTSMTVAKCQVEAHLTFYCRLSFCMVHAPMLAKRDSGLG